MARTATARQAPSSELPALPHQSPAPAGSGLALLKGNGGESRLVVPGDRPAEQVAFESSMVDFFVDAALLLGVPRSVAAIYGIVFASPVPLSFADIEARLDISKGSVSQGLKLLREVGALKEVSTEQDRMELFSPDIELRKLVSRFIENRLQKQLTAGGTRLTALAKAVPGRNHEAKILRERLRKLKNWHSKARALMPVAKAYLNLG